MARASLKSLFTWSGEAIGTVALVLLFFVIVLRMLDVFFPSGTSLKDLLTSKDLMTDETKRKRQLGYAGSDQQQAGAEVTALLTEVTNGVKSKQADAIAWQAARKGAALHDRDAVQTLSDASATITFAKHSVVRLAENSLVIVQRLEQDPVLPRRRSRMMVVDGRLTARLSTADNAAGLDVEVATPTAVAKAVPLRGKDAEFLVQINPDNSSTIAVTSGNATVSAQGRTVRVGPNQLTTIAPDSPPTVPVSMPRPPRPLEPGNDQIYYYRDLPPPVRFRWISQRGVDRYRLTIAQDTAFSAVVYDGQLEEAGFTHANLKDGDYFWRVTTLRNWGESAPSAAQHLRMVQDSIAPALDIQFPPAAVATATTLLQGSTEPGARVFIDGQAVATAADGRFSHEYALRRGANPIVVEAHDAAGNVALLSHIVNGRY